MAVAYLAGSATTIFLETSVGAYSGYSYDSGATGENRFLVVTIVHENGCTITEVVAN